MGRMSPDEDEPEREPAPEEPAHEAAPEEPMIEPEPEPEPPPIYARPPTHQSPPPAYDPPPPPRSSTRDSFGEPDIPMPSARRRGDSQRARDARSNLDLDLRRIKRRKRFGLFFATITVLFVAFVLAP